MEGARFQRQTTELYLQTLRKSRRQGIHSCWRGTTTVTRQWRDLPAAVRAESLPRLSAAGSKVRRVRALPAKCQRRLVIRRQLPQGVGKSKFRANCEDCDNRLLARARR